MIGIIILGTIENIDRASDSSSSNFNASLLDLYKLHKFIIATELEKQSRARWIKNKIIKPIECTEPSIPRGRRTARISSETRTSSKVFLNFILSLE